MSETGEERETLETERSTPASAEQKRLPPLDIRRAANGFDQAV